MSVDNQDRLTYTLKEVAQKLGLSVKTVRVYVKTGKLDFVKPHGKYLIPVEGLDRFLTIGTR